MNDTFDRHAFYGERGGDDCLLVLCGDKRERERKLVVDSVYHSKIMDTLESNQAAFQLAILFLYFVGIGLELQR